MGKSYGAAALSVLISTHQSDADDECSALSWLDLRPDGLYVVEKPGVDDDMIDVITGDHARKRKDGLPLLKVPFSSGQFAQFEADYGGVFSGLLQAGDDTPALLDEIRSRSTAAAELAEVLLGLRKADEADLESTATIALQRQAERYRMCEQAGLKMPKDTYAALPRGIGKIAKKLSISRPALSEDLKKYIAHIAKSGG